MTEDVHRGKVAVITGGGRGFGKAFGTALAALGAHVVLADIDGAAAEAAAAEIAGKGGSASATACDVADEAAVAAVFGEVAAAAWRHRHPRQQRRAALGRLQQALGRDRHRWPAAAV